MDHATHYKISFTNIKPNRAAKLPDCQTATLPHCPLQDCLLPTEGLRPATLKRLHTATAAHCHSTHCHTATTAHWRTAPCHTAHWRTAHCHTARCQTATTVHCPLPHRRLLTPNSTKLNLIEYERIREAFSILMKQASDLSDLVSIKETLENRETQEGIF